MNPLYRLVRRCGVGLALGLTPLTVAVLPTAAHAAAVSPVHFTDRCDGGVDVLLPNDHARGDITYTVNGETVVVGPGQKPVHGVNAATGGEPLVVSVSAQRGTAKPDKTSHDWTRPASCAADLAGDASATGQDAGDASSTGQSAGDASATGQSAGDASATGQDTGDEPADGYGQSNATPPDYAPGYGVDAVGQDASGVSAIAEQPIPADQPSSGALAAGEQAGALPVTGVNTMLFAASGLALIVAGAVLLSLRRRRRVRFEVK